jgi:hypothetical protein
VINRSSVRKLNTFFVIVAALLYLGLQFGSSKTGSNSYNLPLWSVIAIVISIVGLWMLAVFFGLNSWLRLDEYAHMLKSRSDRVAFRQIASGVRFLAYGLLVSSILGASSAYFTNDPRTTAVISQLNYYAAVLSPFFGFWLLREGTRKLAVTAQAALSARSKLVTIGPPVVILAAFYIFMVTTDGAPSAGPLGLLVLPINILLVIGSWIFGLLAALNIERATHGSGASRPQKGFIRLYNGILTMTGGIIILDALMSLGTSRLASLPLALAVVLLYAFVAIVGLGFAIVSSSGRTLVKSAQEDSE